MRKTGSAEKAKANRNKNKHTRTAENLAEMFAKMRKFYTLVFSIAIVLVFAEANGYAESGLQQPTTTEEAPVVGTTVTVGEHALERVQEYVDVKATRQQQQAGRVIETSATTATATVVATTTVTLASSNAPATLTSTNDFGEQVLDTATAPLAQTVIGESNEQAKPTPTNNQVHTLSKNDIRKAPTTKTSEINAAAFSNVATPATPTLSGSASTGGTASKFREAPTANAESKSRADTLPLGNGAASNGGRAAIPKKYRNVAETQIIKNGEELRAERLNERAGVYADELAGERTVSKVRDIETAHGVADGELGVRKVTKQWEVGNKMEAASDIQPIVEKNSETEQVKKPQEEDTAMWLKRAVTPSKQMTGAADTQTLRAKYPDCMETVIKSPAIEETMAEPVKDDTTTTQTAKDGINIELRLQDGLYRIKLAEIVTDEYNGSDAEEKQQVQQAVAGAQATGDATAASDTKPSELLEIQLSSEKGYGKTQSAGDVTTILPTHKPQKQQPVTEQLEQLGQHAQKTTLIKPVKQKAQQQPGEQELVQQQPQQPHQLRRQQLANKDIENRQVQQHNAYTASELDNMNSNHMNKNHENNNKEQNDQVESTKHTSTVILSRSTPQPTPPALNIVDLYPMKMEDFNPIIRDSNAKLLKARTVYKPVGSDEDQKTQPAEGLYERADNVREIGHQQNLLPNEVNAVDNIIQHYDNINNLAAARNSLNRTPITATTAVAPISQQQERQQPQPDNISDFTGKLLAEQDGVITEIEQKFRLNEFAATPTTLPTQPPTTKATPSKERQLTSGKVSYSVNHKVQPTKSTSNKYTKYGASTRRSSPQYDFIERRVKKSFDFPMHRAASVSDALGMPHVDFANTKFNTDSAATQSHSETPIGGVEGGNSALRAVLGAHPEFSTTKFYNSKELYNEMMLHNRQRLKAKAKLEQAAAAATTTKNAVESAASRFALRQSSKLETSKYTPNADSSKAIMGEVNMNSQRRVNSASVAKHVTELGADNKIAANVGSGGAQRVVKSKSIAENTEKKDVERLNQVVTQGNAQNEKENMQMLTAATTVDTADTQSAVGDKPTKKYQKELQRAKMLLKTILLAPTSDNATSANNFKPTAAAVTTTYTIAAGNNQNYSSQANLHAPHTTAVTLGTVTASNLDLVVTAKTFDIMSLQRKSQAVTPPTGTDAAVGNIDSISYSAMMGKQNAAAPLKRVNFDGVDVVHVKRAQPPRIAITASPTTTTTTKNIMTTVSTLPTKKRFSPSTIAADDPKTPLSFIYPYPQMQRTKTTHISQPHDTTATVHSTSSTMVSASSTITTTTTANLSKSSSTPIVRPRILSRLQEKINSLECEIQNLPSDAHLWRGNETHELLLPIMVSRTIAFMSFRITLHLLYIFLSLISLQIRILY